jgi:polysaccharide biosynthesis/export protein
MIRLIELGLPLRALVLTGLLLFALPSLRVLAQPPQAQPGTLPNPVRPDYVLGSEDQIIIRTAQVPEINERPFRIDAEGFIELPIAGRIKAGGLTIRAFETELLTKLREFVVAPQVFITLVQLRGDPVFFVGAFRTPGIYPLSGRRTLIEMLTSVGGLQPNASRRIKITRRTEYGPVPLPNAVESPDKRISTVEINMESLSESVNPEEDIVLQPYDIISAERAEKVYVSGEVGKSASIELGERSSISIAQALTEAGGFTLTAKQGKVRVLRLISGTNRRAEILIDAKQVFAGKARDFPLLPNDVLYVPRAGIGQVIGASIGPGLVTSLPYLLISIVTRR